MPDTRMPSAAPNGDKLPADAQLHQLAEALERGKEHLSLAQRIARIGSIDRDLVTGTVTWSEEALRLFGLSPDAPTPSREEFIALFHPEDREKLLSLVATAEEGRNTEPVECRIMLPDGTVRWLYNASETIRDESGKPRRRIGTFQDVTEIHEVRAREQQQQMQLRRLAEELANRQEHLLIAQRVASTGSIERNALTGRVEWSEEVYRIFGLDPQLPAPTREEIPNLIHPEDRARFIDYMAREDVNAGNEPIEVRTVRRDGTTRWVRHAAETLRDENGRPNRRIGIYSDITAQKEAEQQQQRLQRALEAAKEDAVAASKAKSEFLANMSHEIRTPMNAILGMTALLLDTKLDDEQRKYALTVTESGEALLTLINDILDVSKLEAGKVEIESIDLDLVATVEGAVMLLTAKAREKGLDLSVFIEPEVRRNFRGDPNRLRQVLVNLISNAIKFTETGGVSVEVTQSEGTPSGEHGRKALLRFAVTDTGIGMAPETSEKLFRKFTQADSSITRRYGGTGLGLAISKELIALMGGTIGVESKESAGSTFWFELALPVSAGRIADRDALAGALNGRRALLVDDIAMNRNILARQLQSTGLEVVSVEDGFAALAELERAWHRGKPYDIAFLDQMMPGLSGEDLAARLRASPQLKELKLVLNSSGGRYSLSTEATRLCDAILEKPLRQHELMECLGRLYGPGKAPRAETERPMPPSSSPVSMPAARGAAPLPAPQKPQQQPVAQAAAAQIKILLAEDNRFNQQFAIALLSRAGYAVSVAQDGIEAVEAVQREDYDIVLMDVQMPRCDGVEATRRIRALSSPKNAVPIIALTAHAMAGAREEYLAAGMDDYVSKPIQRDLLLQRIAEMLARGRATPAGNPGSADMSSAPGASGSGLVDVATFEDFLSVAPEDTLATFVSDYLGGIEKAIAETERVAQKGELYPLGRAAHAIISVAGNIGARGVSELARALEEAAKAGERDAAMQLRADLADAGIRALAELRALLARRLTAS